MRVIAGSARSIPLKTTEGLDTRPTTDRIKETLFNMLQMDIPGCYFLDLFAGSGGIGIEALSRGGRSATFVDNSKKACDCIRDNLKATRLDDNASIMETDAVTAINRLHNKGTIFDIVFMDPPYKLGIEPAVLRALSASDIVDEYSTVIIEAAKETDFDFTDSCGFDIIKVKTYKTNKHVFLRKRV